MEAMAESLARYDRGQHTLEYYRLMSWGGLEKTDEYIDWNELLNGKYEKVRKAKKIPR